MSLASVVSSSADNIATVSINENEGGHKIIWNLIKEKRKQEKKNEAAEIGIETTLIFVGCKKAGKSSIVLRFMDKDEVPSPSIALEYNYGRRTRGLNGVKDVVHIWELAGGMLLSDLLQVPINGQNIHNTTFIIIADLEKPDEMIQVVEHFITAINHQVQEILDDLEKRGSKRPKNLRSHALKKYSDNPDRDHVNPCPASILIVGTKYDKFRDFESEKRKLICKTLRYLAHYHGATLFFVSAKDENLMAKCKQLLNQHAFRQNAPKGLNLDNNKPIMVTPGNDTFSQIGPPPSESKDGLGKAKISTWSQWKSDFNIYFPQQEKASEEKLDLDKFPEPRIDLLREQKEVELQKLRRENLRKDKFTAFENSLKSEKRQGKAYSRAR